MDHTSTYAKKENVDKRKQFYKLQQKSKVCGVTFPFDKPWYCGEMAYCCEICNKYYKKNKNAFETI